VWQETNCWANVSSSLAYSFRFPDRHSWCTLWPKPKQWVCFTSQAFALSARVLFAIFSACPCTSSLVVPAVLPTLNNCMLLVVGVGLTVCSLVAITPTPQTLRFIWSCYIMKFGPGGLCEGRSTIAHGAFMRLRASLTSISRLGISYMYICIHVRGCMAVSVVSRECWLMPSICPRQLNLPSD
jgi:hypothetical protein